MSTARQRLIAWTASLVLLVAALPLRAWAAGSADATRALPRGQFAPARPSMEPLFGIRRAAKTWTGATSTDWNDGTNWSSNGVPGAADDVTIPTVPTGGRMPTLGSGTLTIHNLTVQASATVTQTGGSLTVQSFTLGGIWSASGGTVAITTNPNFTGGTNQFFNFSVTGNNVNLNNLGTINVAGDWANSPSGGVTTLTGTTFNFNGTGAQAIGGTTTSAFANVTINKASGTATLGLNSTVSGNLSVTAGTLDLSSFTLNRASAGGTLTVSSGATRPVS